jgi:hypothetical protein
MAVAFHPLYTEKDPAKLEGIVQNGMKILARLEEHLGETIFFLGNVRNFALWIDFYRS